MKSPADIEAITKTAMDYFEGWYDGDVARMERMVHPDLCKRGWKQDSTGVAHVNTITAKDLLSDTNLYTTAFQEFSAKPLTGTAPRPAELEIRVNVDDVHGDIATATIYTTVWIEYLQLVRIPDGWQVLNTLYARR
ncbi:MAG: nuclear transport factor 2 family protein [Kofleriaceae bacterium]